MGAFLDLLAFIGSLYKLVVAGVIMTAVGGVLLAVFLMIASVIDWIF